MHVTKIITQMLSGVIHKTRVQSLAPIITAIITFKQLRLTQLGRNLNSGGKERSAIRRIDRLLANSYYQTQSIDIYKAITQRVVAHQGRPIILVDWTSLPNSDLTTEGGAHSAIRASLIAEVEALHCMKKFIRRKKRIMI